MWIRNQNSRTELIRFHDKVGHILLNIWKQQMLKDEPNEFEKCLLLWECSIYPHTDWLTDQLTKRHIEALCQSLKILLSWWSKHSTVYYFGNINFYRPRSIFWERKIYKYGSLFPYWTISPIFLCPPKKKCCLLDLCQNLVCNIYIKYLLNIITLYTICFCSL